MIPIQLRTRETLEMMYENRAWFDVNTQRKIVRELDRRNRLRHLGKPFRLMLLLLLLSINVGPTFISAQSVVDTTVKYEWSMNVMNESDDCAVRALASIGYDYPVAHQLLKDNGRENGQGVSMRILLKTLIQVDRVKEVAIIDKHIRAKDFINTIYDNNYYYMLFNKYHIYTLKDKTVYGNHNDKYTPIIGYIKLSKQ